MEREELKSDCGGESMNFQVQYCPKWVNSEFRKACRDNGISKKDMLILIARNLVDIILRYLHK